MRDIAYTLLKDDMRGIREVGHYVFCLTRNARINALTPYKEEQYKHLILLARGSFDRLYEVFLYPLVDFNRSSTVLSNSPVTLSSSPVVFLKLSGKEFERVHNSVSSQSIKKDHHTTTV